MSEQWQLWEREESQPAAWNMAADENLLATVEEIGKPVLRFYQWSEDAASFGYFQSYAEVEKLTEVRPLVRRPTGGGLVLHDHDRDWTYSLAFPPGHFWYQLRAPQSYELLHTWLRDSFLSLGVEAYLAPCCDKQHPGKCFAGPEKSDLMLAGQKIAGAAQRRSKQGLLIQGSIQPIPEGIPHEEFAATMVTLAMARWGVEWSGFDRRGWWNAGAEMIYGLKYSQPEYHQKR